MDFSWLGGLAIKIKTWMNHLQFIHGGSHNFAAPVSLWFVPHAKISTLFWVFQPLESPKKHLQQGGHFHKVYFKKKKKILTSPCRFVPESNLLANIIYFQVRIFWKSLLFI